MILRHLLTTNNSSNLLSPKDHENRNDSQNGYIITTTENTVNHQSTTSGIFHETSTSRLVNNSTLPATLTVALTAAAATVGVNVPTYAPYSQRTTTNTIQSANTSVAVSNEQQQCDDSSIHNALISMVIPQHHHNPSTAMSVAQQTIHSTSAHASINDNVKNSVSFFFI
ncbi:unnamed protein product [Dracunculus medinensis]|uniref:Uncharacterized protein n=1 Tax=Dracunculus medinensis TaxID=318479 RepID=A0A0N4U0T4_DRAME|nr:unnamed protein product [Dracunculus medinensis]